MSYSLVLETNSVHYLNFISACDNCTGTNLDDWFLDKGLEISSNMGKYRKLVDITSKGLAQWVAKCAGVDLHFFLSLI